MGRVLILILIVVAIWLLWKAFGPGSRPKQAQQSQPPAIKGPDDDEEFLWNIEKERFKQRREQEAREQAQREEEERKRRRGPDEPPAEA